MTTLVMYFVLYGAPGTFTQTFTDSMACDAKMISLGSYIKSQGGSIQSASCSQPK